MTRPVRLPSTEEQIRAALTAGLPAGADPCRWVDARDACTPEERAAVGSCDARWVERMPVHAILAALVQHRRAHLDSAPQRSRERTALADEVREVRAAARRIVAAAHADIDALAGVTAGAEGDQADDAPTLWETP